MSDTDSEPEQTLEKKPTKKVQAKKAQVKKATPPPDAPVEAPVEAVEAVEAPVENLEVLCDWQVAPLHERLEKKPKRLFTEKQKEALAAARLKRKLARDAEAEAKAEPEAEPEAEPVNVVKPKRVYKKKVVLAEPEPEPPKPKRVYTKKAAAPAPLAPAYYPSIDFV